MCQNSVELVLIYKYCQNLGFFGQNWSIKVKNSIEWVSGRKYYQNVGLLGQDFGFQAFIIKFFWK